MRKFLATTALCLTMATGAHADTHADAKSSGFLSMAEATDVMGSEFIGMRIYTAEYDDSDADSMTVQDSRLMAGDAEREWDDIGEVHDIVLARDGNVKAVLVDIGGFLGIGEKTVALTMNDIRFVPEDDGSGEFFLVVNRSEDQLKSAPEFDTAARDHKTMKTDGTMAETETVAESLSAGKDPFVAQDFRKEGFETVDVSQLTAEDLDGARVYGVNDEDVGEISSLLLAGDGKIESAVIDVGGFLGLGETPVKVGFDRLSIQREANSGSVNVYIDASEESLKELPEYDG